MCRIEKSLCKNVDHAYTYIKYDFKETIQCYFFGQTKWENEEKVLKKVFGLLLAKPGAHVTRVLLWDLCRFFFVNSKYFLTKSARMSKEELG